MANSEDKDLAAELEVIAGNPTEKELAAVVAVLREAVSTTESAEAEPNWAKGGKMLREGNGPGASEWRSDFKGEI
jgi:hypothetical protein